MNTLTNRYHRQTISICGKTIAPSAVATDPRSCICCSLFFLPCDLGNLSTQQQLISKAMTDKALLFPHCIMLQKVIIALQTLPLGLAALILFLKLTMHVLCNPWECGLMERTSNRLGKSWCLSQDHGMPRKAGVGLHPRRLCYLRQHFTRACGSVCAINRGFVNHEQIMKDGVEEGNPVIEMHWWQCMPDVVISRKPKECSIGW